MSTTRTIGKLQEHGDKRGTLYTQTFFVLDTEKDTYIPTYHQNGSDSPFNFPANTYIYDWDVSAVSDHWLIVVKACDNDFDWGDDTTSLIGCINEQGDNNGIKYSGKWLVAPQDKIAYTPSYGIDGDQSPWNFPENTFIYGWTVKSAMDEPPNPDDGTTDYCNAKSWIIEVYACNNDYNWKEANRVGNITDSGSWRGTLYTAVYLVPDSEKQLYTPIYQQAGNSVPFGLPSGTYIYEWRHEPVYTNPVKSDDLGGMTDVTLNTPAHWLVTIKGCNNDYIWPDGRNDGVDELKVYRSFGVGTIYIDPEWFGMCQWQHHKNYSKWVRDNAPGSDAVTPIKACRLALNSSDYAYDPKDLVFANAEEDTQGSPVISETAKAIWVNTTTLQNDYMDAAGNNVQTVTYKVTFFQSGTKTYESYADWSGVNGGFTPPAGCRPLGYEDAGMWKSTHQETEENAQKFNDTYYHKIEREMIKAPGDLKWKAGSINGAVWDW